MKFQKLTYELKRHFSDSTAIVTIFNPIAAPAETVVADISDEVSLKSRLLTVAVTYGGLGSITKIRDWSKQKVGIDKESSGLVKWLYDAAFAATSVLIIRPSIYLASGETDWEKILIGTVSTTGLAALLGGPGLYFIDAFRDLVGFEESERLPKLVERQPPKIKKRIAATLIAASIAATGLVYYLTPEKNQEVQQAQTTTIENVVNEEFVP